jgi:hypothetical protein
MYLFTWYKLLQSGSTKLNNIKIIGTEEETSKYFEAVGEKFHDTALDGI